MSEYTFQNETVIAPNSTVPLGATDNVPVFSQGNARLRTATIGSASSIVTVTSATSATTGTNITAWGYTSLGSSSGPITAWMLDPPLTSGVVKSIMSISTSTAHTVTVSTTLTNVTIYSTANTIGRTLTFSAPGAYVELVAQSTSIWSIIGKAATVVCT